ncbi:MAG: SdrD B-like domain-containing protein [Pirellulales bacterium]
MGLYDALRDLFSGTDGALRVDAARPKSLRTPHSALRTRPRRCQIEPLEPRRLMAADTVPQVLLGSVYFEEATGDDSAPDVLEVSFVGGADGTTLDRITINGDKKQDGLTEGDIFFDTTAGGLGAFAHGGLKITSANGFTVNSVTVVDGGSQIVFNLSGFDAGEKLVFSVDADEAQYVDGNDVDSNSLVEGAEFQRSLLVGNMSAVGYVDLTLTGTYWDAFDANFSAAYAATGLTLNLPKDAYSTTHDYTDRTAGAVAYKPQIPLASISGWVYHDRSDDGVFNRATEEGIGGVTVELLDANGNPTGITTTTSNNSATRGFYEFRNLTPGKYGVREVQPTNYLDGKDTAGSHGGTAANESAGRVDRIIGAMLDYGDHAVDYNFGELLPGSISGRVHADTHEDCDFDEPDILLAGMRIDLLDGAGNFIRFTLTDAKGEYSFTGLAPGNYRIREHQPTDYYDGGERVGSVGGAASDVPGVYSIFTGISIGSGVNAIRYDFCEKVGLELSGYVYHDRDDDGNYDRSGANPETPIANVVLKLLNGAGGDTGLRATTDANGFYKFTNLAAGTYTVVEVQPAGWLDGKDTPGNLSGVADASPPGDRLSQIVMHWGHNGFEYNFGELLPASISGRIHADDGPDCNFDDPHHMLVGVRVDLLDVNGAVLATTTTNAAGEYLFTGLRPGTYTVREHQPTEYFDGGERVGSVGGVASDVADVYSIIAGINLGSGVNAIQYDFCEKPGVMLSGNVYHDRDDDGIFDRTGSNIETGIVGVVVKLLDASGNDTGLRATTDAGGFYKFNNLAAGKYAVMEVHPAGWLDGKDTPGNLGGVADVSPPGDMISQIMINWGQMGTEYNFGELLPGSITGRIHADDGPDCDFDDPHHMLQGVVVDLLDNNGTVVKTTTTNADGVYLFSGLRPGTYTVREHQPTEYFDGGERVGSVGGEDYDEDGYSIFTGIVLGSGVHAVQYDFCEKPGAELSGYVFVDGAPIVTQNTLTPDDIADLKDGKRTADDRMLAGVVVELRHGRSGDPIFVGQALAGHYAGGPDAPIRTVTDANGFYKFTGLAAGTYAVIEVPPEDLIDGIDTPGTTGGVALNPLGHKRPPLGQEIADIPPPVSSQTLEQFRQQFGRDVVLAIPLQYGQHSQENNFSEVEVVPPRPFIPPDEPPPVKPPVFGGPETLYVPKLVLPPIPVRNPPELFYGGAAHGYTWHLSVVNAGWPRSMTEGDVIFQFTSAEIDATGWQNVRLDAAQWTLAKLDYNNVVVLRQNVFGSDEATPVVGDFNGDGVCDIGVFIDGQWFLDLNGNGRWDEGDLWAKLGSGDDLPVTGDWDADGKTDIGIYGPAWPRDPWAISREPGLPDPDNFPTSPVDVMKNMPPTPDDATSGGRLLKRTAKGQKRADLIDHVFHYGVPGDVPITGDWNGDGTRQIGVFSDGEWQLDLNGDGRFTEVDATIAFGAAGDLPVVGDFNGDGVDEIGVYRAGEWTVDTNGDRQLDAQDKVFELGGADDIPVVGDWNDDGTDDPGVYHPGTTAEHVSRRAG